MALAAISDIFARSTCHYIQAQAGDGCYSLAERCGISQKDLVKYNPSPNFCNNLLVGDYVCCSAGSLPDFSPKPGSDGSCASYAVKTGDTCSSIATANQIKNYTKIEEVNHQTWGWSGCKRLLIGQKICLSSGTPPFPAAVQDTVCGPQVPGTKQPKGMSPSNWTNLNPCPLNACCDVWGQCGISAEFCTATPADTKAPGTAKPGTNGCISNCGHKVKNNARGPGSARRVGYFEAWNEDRPCLHMKVRDLQDTKSYTHVHWGFANLTANWKPDVSGSQSSFDDLKGLTGIKRIVSFGGWAISTEPATYTIFRNGVLPENRQTFANNVVKFVKDHGLDGVDFDWEYPGAQDIPGIPADSIKSGENYLEFLKLVKKQMGAGRTVSIAAPASYWYLKGFPIKDIAKTIDYIIYMTYDMHGQWDYGNKFADPGCPGGSCLRSQINDTETSDALAMITKAGVPANQVVVGMPLYGRSFKMAQSGCTSENCLFTGPESGAAPGRCTKTAGYISNFEINEIIKEQKAMGKKIKQYYDEGDVLVYNGTEWVSWMTPTTYKKRRAYTDGLNFGGTSDWAIDLSGDFISDAGGSGHDRDDMYDHWAHEADGLCDYARNFDSLDDLNEAAPGMDSTCIDIHTLDVLIKMFDTAYKNYTDVNNGYDEMFGYYVTYMKKLVPQVLSNNFMFNLSTTGKYANVPDPGYGMDNFNCAGGKNGNEHYPCKDILAHMQTQDEVFNDITFTVTDHDKYIESLGTAGLSPDWVDLGDYEYDRDVSQPHASRKWKYQFHGFPIENSSMVVPNPKDVVTKGLGSIPDLRRDMVSTLAELMLGQYADNTNRWDKQVTTSSADPMMAYSSPVFMLMQAVDSMAQAKELGQEEKKEEEEEEKRKKDFILLIVSVVLMFVPIVGEGLAEAAGLAVLARAISIAGELGNAAFDIYQTVDDPSSAIVNILGSLIGVGSIAKLSRDGKGIGDIAKLRRGMKDDAVKSMGAIFKNQNDKIGSLAKFCKYTIK